MMFQIFSIPELFQEISKYLKFRDLVNLAEEYVHLIKKMLTNTCHSKPKE